jgi:RNA polymerase sigma factor (sigma-70 family)
MRRITTSYYEHHLRRQESLLSAIVSQFSRQSSAREEMMRVAESELLWAMIHFDPEINANFKYYVMTRVKRRLQHYLRDEAKHTRMLPSNDYSFDNLNYEDDPVPRLVVEEILDVCTQLERTVVWGRHAEGKSIRRIAAEKGVSRRRVARALRSGLSKIHDHFPDPAAVLS